MQINGIFLTPPPTLQRLPWDRFESNILSRYKHRISVKEEEAVLPGEQPDGRRRRVWTKVTAHACKEQEQRQQRREEHKDSVRLDAEDSSSRTGCKVARMTTARWRRRSEEKKRNRQQLEGSGQMWAGGNDGGRCRTQAQHLQRA